MIYIRFDKFGILKSKQTKQSMEIANLQFL